MSYTMKNSHVPSGPLLKNTEKVKEIFREEVEEIEHFTDADHKEYSKEILELKKDD